MRPEGTSTHAAAPRSRGLIRRRTLLVAAALAGLPLTARATPKSFNFGGISTNWRDGANWIPGGEPLAGDDAFVLNADPVDRIVTYNTFQATAPILSSVHIDALGTGLLTLSQSAQVLRANTQYLGDSGTGIYVQNGGTNQAGTLYLGFDSTATGIYSMTGTARLQIASAMYVGYSGTGNFNQLAGNVSVDPGGELVVAYFAGSSGSYSIAAGTLSTPTLRIGDDFTADGHFQHSGGTVTVTGDASLGSFDATSAGSYTITGGTLTVGSGAGGGNLVVGERGSGTFLQSGGTVLVNSGGSPSGTNGLVLGLDGADLLTPASVGTYDLIGTGLLSVTGRAFIGFSGDATFTQSGGTHNINGEMVIAANGDTGATGAYVLSGGFLTAGAVTLNTGGTFTRTGGTMGVGTFTQDGGTVNGTLTNIGSFIYNQGTFNGRLVNQAASTVTFNSDFTAADGIDNFTTFTIDPITTVTVNGFGLSNNLAGHIDMAGGVLTGSGPISNKGLLSGFGTISGTGGVTNDGDWVVDPGDYIVSNSGTLTNNKNLVISSSLTGVSLVLDQPAVQLQNKGTIVINPNGSIGGPGSLLNTATGLINATDATITAPFTNQGTVNIGSAGTGNLHVSGNFNNTGTINLTGPLTSLTGGAITNAVGGTISGQGQVANPIANSGTIRNNAASTVLDLSGAVTNLSTGLITVGSGATISADLLSNAGTISVNDGTFSSTAFTNAGAVNVNGGVLDMDSVTNNAGGIITYSPGTVPIQSFGQITNNAGGKIRLGGASPTAFFYDPITHNAGASIEVPAGATANFLASVSGGGAVTNSGTITFATGTTNALGEISGGGTLSVSDAATLSTPRFTQGPVNLISTGVTGAALNVDPAATNGVSTSKVTALSITGDSVPQAKLNLANTNLVIDYPALGPSPLLTTRAQIRSAYNGGAWNGNGITSSSAAANSARALGYGEASGVLGLSGTATASWNGQTVDASSVLIGYTLSGDANLDHTVGFNDLVALAQNYNVLDGSRVWTQGDFTYDGNVDFTDLVKLAQNYNLTLPAAGAIPGAAAGFEEDLARAFAAVPEPGVGALVTVGAALAGVHRRRRGGTSRQTKPPGLISPPSTRRR
jgi:fibronectin-binding autotransporter adhesin